MIKNQCEYGFLNSYVVILLSYIHPWEYIFMLLKTYYLFPQKITLDIFITNIAFFFTSSTLYVKNFDSVEI